MLQRLLTSLAFIHFVNATGIYRVPVPHLVRDFTRDWTGSPTILLTSHNGLFLGSNLRAKCDSTLGYGGVLETKSLVIPSVSISLSSGGAFLSSLSMMMEFCGWSLDLAFFFVVED